MFHQIARPDDHRDLAGHLDGADESAWEAIVSGLYDKRQRATARTLCIRVTHISKRGA